MAVFLRGISHVRMAVLISRLQHLDLGDADGFGISGNLILAAFSLVGSSRARPAAC
jgi:hypothetical protein